MEKANSFSWGWFHQYQYRFYTGIHFHKFRQRYIFKDFGRYEVELEYSKIMGGLDIGPRYRTKNKTEVHNFYTSVLFFSFFSRFLVQGIVILLLLHYCAHSVFRKVSNEWTKIIFQPLIYMTPYFLCLSSWLSKN